MRAMKKWNSTPIYPPGMTEMKAVDVYGKCTQFIYDSFNHLICSKPADEMLKKIKDHLLNARNTRLEALQLDKDDVCFVIIGMEDKGEKRCIDGNNVFKDVFFLMIRLIQIILMLKKNGNETITLVSRQKIYFRVLLGCIFRCGTRIVVSNPKTLKFIMYIFLNNFVLKKLPEYYYAEMMR